MVYCIAPFFFIWYFYFNWRFKVLTDFYLIETFFKKKIVWFIGLLLNELLPTIVKCITEIISNRLVDFILHFNSLYDCDEREYILYVKKDVRTLTKNMRYCADLP